MYVCSSSLSIHVPNLFLEVGDVPSGNKAGMQRERKLIFRIFVCLFCFVFTFRKALEYQKESP